MNKDPNIIQLELQFSHKSNEIINLAYEKDADETETQTSNQTSAPGSAVVFQFKEGGWGWFVLFCATWSYGLFIAFYTNAMLIYPYMIDFYNGTEKNNVAYTAWILSTSYGVQYLISAASSALLDYFGPIQIGVFGGFLSSTCILGSAILFDYPHLMKLHFLTYGVLVSIGQGFIVASSFAILPHYFSKRLGLVNGIMNAGGCVMIILFAFILGYLLESFGLKVTFLFMSAMSATSTLTSLAFRPQLTKDLSTSSSGGGRKASFTFKDSWRFDILKKPKFIIWTLSSVLALICNMIPLMTMAHYAKINFPNFRPEILNIIYGVGSAVGSLLFGKLTDYFKCSVVYNFMIAYTVYVVATVVIEHIKQLYVYCIAIAIFSAFDGVFLGSLMPMACEITESNLYGNQALGYFKTIIAPTLMFGPTLAGFMFDMFGSYSEAYVLSYLIGFIGVIILLIYPGNVFVSFFANLRNKLKRSVNARF